MTFSDVYPVKLFGVFLHCHQLLPQILHPPKQIDLIISGMNLDFIFETILSLLLIFCLPLQHLSAYSSSYHSAACPLSLVTTCLTFLSSSTLLYSKCLSRALIQYRISLMSRLPSYMGISIFFSTHPCNNSKKTFFNNILGRDFLSFMFIFTFNLTDVSNIDCSPFCCLHGIKTGT
jgi:hypothetical protein